MRRMRMRLEMVEYWRRIQEAIEAGGAGKKAVVHPTFEEMSMENEAPLPGQMGYKVPAHNPEFAKFLEEGRLIGELTVKELRNIIRGLLAESKL